MGPGLLPVAVYCTASGWAGPVFTARLHIEALTRGKRRQRRWVIAELIVTAAILIVAFQGNSDAWRFHVLAMTAAHCLTAFFAVWTVHHDCEDWKYRARTIRSRWKSDLVLGMFFHSEHHLDPAVPTRRLPILAERLDTAAGDLSKHQVY